MMQTVSRITGIRFIHTGTSVLRTGIFLQ